MNIPQKIHYVWLGKGQKTPLIIKCIDSWRRQLPNYEIKEWNENNFDLNIHPWIVEMYAQKKYAFASDLVRLYVLKNEGGIYLDTDIEIHKNLDCFLHTKMFMGFMYDCALGTSILGTVANYYVIDDLINIYDSLINQSPLVNNTIFTKYFINAFPEFKLGNKKQIIGDNIHIFPKEYFEVPTFSNKMGYARHHATRLWDGGNARRSPMKRILNTVIGDVLYYKLVQYKCLKNNEFYFLYKQHTTKQ
ncbi:MAG: glycosyltransferase family 32 protein [Pleurocapsa sp.]